MTRPPITLTAAEWASVQPDGTLWLAWEGVRVARYPELTFSDNEPPAVFVQACTPCERRGVEHEGCGYLASHWCNKCGQVVPCPDCRIELVGPCPTCDGEPFDPKVHLGRCPDCDSTLTVTLGHAYAVGQPLPIIDGRVEECPRAGNFIYLLNGRLWLRRDGEGFDVDLTAALAHYGPPETLVDRWAVQLQVVGS